ncbi:hypothetical protein EJ08DRAFT_695706 [Tothia fuscella]|uniref:Elongator complex protein 5 n=1 Tax=Tothia fuscella TaxID=1048955 RepID=A0A9P4NV29_9PEZI|nr:hypothetical protein EJ08DRAFT_695706 [Tothia fuscella]
MATSKALQHRRTHNLLLINKLLNWRENASPFTLILDSLEQRGKTFLREIIRRAAISRADIIFVSWETLRKSKDVTTFIHAHNLSPVDLQKKISNCRVVPEKRTILIFDTLHPLLSTPSLNIPQFLSQFPSPTLSLIALFHTDVPLPNSSPYSPSPLVLLKYMATTIFTLDNLEHLLLRKKARDRSVGEPVWGLNEGIEGVIIGLSSRKADGIVCEMEYRRKSGRAVIETFCIPTTPPTSSSSKPTPHTTASSSSKTNTITLLQDHPLYSKPSVEEANDEVDVTFSLGLTEKQRRDREGVVLPYFDAQESGGGGEGGRILYDLGVEDDFDEEEDEI